MLDIYSTADQKNIESNCRHVQMVPFKTSFINHRTFMV